MVLKQVNNKLGEHDLVIKDLREALLLSPNNYNLMIQLGLVLKERRAAYAEAALLFGRARDLSGLLGACNNERYKSALPSPPLPDTPRIVRLPIVGSGKALPPSQVTSTMLGLLRTFLLKEYHGK